MLRFQRASRASRTVVVCKVNCWNGFLVHFVGTGTSIAAPLKLAVVVDRRGAPESLVSRRAGSRVPPAASRRPSLLCVCRCVTVRARVLFCAWIQYAHKVGLCLSHVLYEITKYSFNFEVFVGWLNVRVCCQWETLY